MYAIICLRLSFLQYLGALISFSWEFGSWDWKALFSVICRLPWCLAVVMSCLDQPCFSPFNFQNCLNSSKLLSVDLGFEESASIAFYMPSHSSPVKWGQHFHDWNFLSIIWERYELWDDTDCKTTFPQEIWLDIKKCFFIAFVLSALLCEVLGLLFFFLRVPFYGYLIASHG